MAVIYPNNPGVQYPAAEDSKMRCLRLFQKSQDILSKAEKELRRKLTFELTPLNRRPSSHNREKFDMREGKLRNFTLQNYTRSSGFCLEQNDKRTGSAGINLHSHEAMPAVSSVKPASADSDEEYRNVKNQY
jgi:hypothetical protein